MHMDDEAKELLREIRDLQKEQATLYRQWCEQSAEIHRLRKESELIYQQNQLEWRASRAGNKRWGKWAIVIFCLWFAFMLFFMVVQLIRGNKP